ncbi:hypothetical protein CDES_07135 [Corynebacterium deserti GIMN1.010]|uniref:FCS-type domain-containing protein n=1 Tax=Corynebacterium deserti GIMN1.010 TaxID=931089 RepID=A0A0M4CG26_9CORY|nr:hypothetical protein [Corynebacterium deserti]ALC05840.1 hypothetical protein CDES_07135 [Corynebacterium deserti GIMN1.010]
MIPNQPTPTCAWCGKDVASTGRGRPRKYCSQACRQRAYEQRNNVSGTNIPAEAVIMSPDKANELKDSLFELRCAAEDIATAVNDGEEARDIAALSQELVDLARNIEKLR